PGRARPPRPAGREKEKDGIQDLFGRYTREHRPRRPDRDQELRRGVRGHLRRQEEGGAEEGGGRRQERQEAEEEEEEEIAARGRGRSPRPLVLPDHLPPGAGSFSRGAP